MLVGNHSHINPMGLTNPGSAARGPSRRRGDAMSRRSAKGSKSAQKRRQNTISPAALATGAREPWAHVQRLISLERLVQTCFAVLRLRFAICFIRKICQAKYTSRSGPPPSRYRLDRRSTTNFVTLPIGHAAPGPPGGCCQNTTPEGVNLRPRRAPVRTCWTTGADQTGYPQRGPAHSRKL